MTGAPALVEERSAQQAAQECFAVITATLARKSGRHGAPMQVAVVGSEWPTGAVRKHFVPHGLTGVDRLDAFDTPPHTILTAIKPAF